MLYIAGPRSMKVWMNGQLADAVQSDVTSPLGMHVYATSVAKFLKPGANTIAIEAVRGRGVSGFANSAIVRQQTFGQVLVVKIVPAAQIESSVLARFLRSNRAARELVTHARDYDVNRIRYRNPFIPVLRFTVGTGLEIVSRHQRRHLLQAERVKQTVDFPGRECDS